MQALLRYANYTHVAKGLTEAGYSVSAATVSRWAQGRNVTPMTVRLVADLLQIETAESPPAWAEGLATRTAISVIEALAPGHVQEAAAVLLERLEGTPQPSGGSPRVTGGLEDQAGAEQPKPVRE